MLYFTNEVHLSKILWVGDMIPPFKEIQESSNQYRVVILWKNTWFSFLLLTHYSRKLPGGRKLYSIINLTITNYVTEMHIWTDYWQGQIILKIAIFWDMCMSVGTWPKSRLVNFVTDVLYAGQISVPAETVAAAATQAGKSFLVLYLPQVLIKSGSNRRVVDCSYSFSWRFVHANLISLLNNRYHGMIFCVIMSWVFWVSKCLG